MSVHNPGDFKPPSVPLPTPLHTYTNFSPVPSSIRNYKEDEPLNIIIGIDEAGRGPIIGPMVYSIAYCTEDYGKNVLPTLEFADSKKLTEPKRWELMKFICEQDNDNSELGYVITSLSSLDISTNMLRPSQLVVNLNEQAHNATIELIKGLIEKLGEINDKIKVSGIFIDTVGPPVSYLNKLRLHFPKDLVTDIRVEKKADGTYPIVSAASVVAKVSRDWFLECSSNGNNWGSGYPSDPKTSSWINTKLDPWFGWDHNIRYSWGTAKDALLKSKTAIEMRWEHELIKKHGYDDVLGMLQVNNVAETTNAENFQVFKDWFI